ncbi:hypothetical protein [Streptomyces sp. NPDC085540]|uniref:hypothetical protein n=1 Tax=Streptomyces sp. NPDC085540 TaxID=3365730 RepID=UPI0037D73F3B
MTGSAVVHRDWRPRPRRHSDRRPGAVRYEHDGQGRVALRQRTRLARKPDAWRYGWDTEGRLTAVTSPDGTVWR